MNKTFELLAYDRILNDLAERASSAQTKETIRKLQPYLGETELRRNLRDTTQAREMLDMAGMPPLPVIDHVEEYLEKSIRSELLTPDEIGHMATFLVAVKRMHEYLERGKDYQIGIAFYNENLQLMEDLHTEIERSIRNGCIDDYASNQLRDIRRELLILEEKMGNKAEALMKAHKSCMSESFIVKRNGRICLPVKAEYKTKITGSIIDKSTTGSTLFIEPEALSKLREEFEFLKIEEDGEERRILYAFMNMIAERETEFRSNLETILKLDFMFAKGKLSLDQQAVEPAINTTRYIRLENARHPLLPREVCVPLDFELGRHLRGMVITGPNMGGKTVAIKTVGLLSMMACSGMHVPCASADICMNNQVLCDIGDGQNITDNLSTFSAHISNVITILDQVTHESLVIFDELGSGTDPTEGMGIAIAILEQLRCSGCLFLATTHYPEVKTYVESHDDIINARMAFHRESLKPLYRLEIGKAGDSCALYIAKRLGMPDDLIRMAASEAYGEGSTEIIQELNLGRENTNPIRKKEVPKLITIPQKQTIQKQITTFSRGDSVVVYPEEVIGIVVKPADQHGNVLVQIKKDKVWINHKRLKVKVPAAELYPEDYDFSIIFDTVENRKARHRMGKRHQQGVTISVEE